MTDNKISDVERELWKKVFHTSQSVKKHIERYHILREECEKEENLTGSPSREQIDELKSIEIFLNDSIFVLEDYSFNLKELNPNYKWN